MLRARGPSPIVSGHEVSVGELVTIRDSPGALTDVQGRDLPPFAVFGTVEHIDLDRGELVIDFATAGSHTIAIDSAAAAALEYGYAEHTATAGVPAMGLPTLERLQDLEPFEIELEP